MPRELIESNVRDFSQQVDRPEQENMEHAMEHAMEHPVMEPAQEEEFLEKSREMILLREQKARLEKREIELKTYLNGLLAQYGEPYGTEGQHVALSFPKPIRGIARFVRQTKSSTTVDEVKAEAIARRNGIYERLFKPVMTLDQSAVMVALEEDLITEVDLAEIFPRKVSNAFTVEKAR